MSSLIKDSKLENKGCCEHDWQPKTVNSGEVETVYCKRCGQVEMRYVIAKNPNFPFEEFP
jgi:hypothetical protein